jgi:WD40 repeat protein
MVSGGFVRNIKRRDTHEYLSAACGGKSLVMWHLDPAQGELQCHPVGTAGKHIREFICLSFTPDYEHLLAGTTSGDVAVVLVKNRVVQSFTDVCSAGVMGVACIPNAGGLVRVVAGGGDGTVTILSGPSAFELREEKQIRVDGPVASVSLNGDATEVLTVCTTGSSWKVRSKDLAMKLHNQVSSGALYHVAYPRAISDHFLTCCGDGLVTLWDANDYSARVRCPTRTRAYPISVDGSEDIIVAGCSDGRLMSFDCAQGQNLWHIDNAHKAGVTAVQLASNMRFVLTGGAEGELRVWEVKTKEMMSHLKEHQARVTDLKLFPNDEYAISASRDRCLLTWHLRSEKRLTAHREKHGGINCLAVASDQVTVFTAGQEKTLTTWDLRMADPVRTISLDEEIYSLSLSPDDRYLAMGGTSLQVKIWDVVSGIEKSKGVGHSRTIQKLAFSPDGKQLVSVGLDHSILMWNVYT